MVMPEGPRRIRPLDSIGKNLSVRTAVQESVAPQATGFVYNSFETFSSVPTPKPNIKRKVWKRVLVGIIAVIFGIPALAATLLAISHSKGKFSVSSLVVSAAKAAVVQTVSLKGQDQNRTNMVIYGMTKDGLRTDSIMLASYYYSQKKLVTVNIPRDLYVWDGYEYCKMGEVYAYAKARKPKDSTYPDKFVADLLSREYGIPVHYWTQFNMQGEVDLINALGGVDINVPDSFTDYEYPTWNYSGYVRPAPHFSAGLQHMNGDTALIYSRSRHSVDNGEGTDFARSKRQQLVLQAMMTKVKTLGIVGNLADISHYLTILGNNVNTSMSTDEMISFANTLKGIDEHSDYLQANWAVGNGFLCSSTSDAGAYITLYGTAASCGVSAGGKQDSAYRQDAIAYVQNLLASAMPPPTPSPTTSPATGP